MRVIYKYPLVESFIKMKKGAQILHADIQHGRVCLWALVDPNAKDVLREIGVLQTESRVDDAVEGHNHIGTILDGSFVWHVFDAGEGD